MAFKNIGVKPKTHRKIARIVRAVGGKVWEVVDSMADQKLADIKKDTK